MRDVLSMKWFGQFGRTGNQFFQYMFLRLHADEHGLELLLPPWDVAPMFDARHRAPPPDLGLPVVFERRDQARRSHPPTKVLRNVDVLGYFQYHMSYYRPMQARIRKIFSLSRPAKTRFLPAIQAWRPPGVLVGLHLRQSDYGWGIFYRTPVAWYLDWLAQNWAKLPEPKHLFVASDDPAAAAPFSAYRPIVAPSLPGTPSWFPDFYGLAHCDLLLMPNSTFSFAAALIGNPRMKVLRSDPDVSAFRPIDVWDCDPLRKDFRYQDHPERTELWLRNAGTTVPAPGSLFAQYLTQSLRSDW